ncbi:MAG: hypothetical protein LRY50_09665, partial [Geovibrio sp.]|nr:hypothetical protein [Geovibrio sp.]
LTIFSRLFQMNLDNFTTLLMITNTGSFLALLLFFKRDVGTLIKGTWCFIVRKDETGKEDFRLCLKITYSDYSNWHFWFIYERSSTQ